MARVDRSGATQNATRDPELDIVVENWDRLSAVVRAGILALVKASVER
jgi:hypothetical protein